MFTWTGFYVGLNLGGGWRERHDNNDWWGFAPFFFAGGPFFPFGFGGWGNNGNNSGGVVGGGQIGYNYQFSPWLVVGLETDFQGTSIGSGSGNGGWWWWGGNGERIPWFGTVRGRIGITPFDPHFLIYGTGGFAYGEVRHDDFFWGSWGRTKTGWTAGGGVEWAPVSFPNWSVKVEYLYTDLSSGGDNGWGWGWGWGGGDHWHTRFHTVRAGVNYHFNLFNPSPVVAKY
jgi:outer membrane immunogenic protein